MFFSKKKTDAEIIREMLDKAKIYYNDYGWKILLEDFHYSVEIRFTKNGRLVSIEGYE